MAYMLLTLVTAAVGLVYLYLRNLYAYWEKRGVVQETPLLGLGNMKGIGRSVHFRDVNQRIYRRFKGSAPFAGMFLFLSKVAFIMDLDLIKQILIKDFSSFHDRGIFNNVRDDPLTGHLLTLEGEEWRALRHKLTPVFTSGKMKFMFPTVVAVAENLVKACGAIVDASANGELDVKDLSARYTTDVIGTCAFGIECNSLQDPNAEFRVKGRSIFGRPRHGAFVQAFMITNPRLARKMHMKFFPDDVSEFFIGAVKRTVEYRIKNGVKRNDFMDLLIEMKAKDEEKALSGRGIDLSHGLTLLQMAAQAFIFFLAGFETSSTTMTFCLFELAINEPMQEKLRQEILTVLKAHKDEITYESMKEMKYLQQIFSETLRKYPVLPNIIRQATADFAVPNTSHIIEKGTNIIIPVHAIQHDPEIFPDPEKFDPERFTAEAIEQRHSAAYLPFGDGPRNCIGNRFGKMQAMVGLISLLRNYKFSVSKRTEIPAELDKKNFLTTTKNAIYLRAECIKRN